MPHRATGPDQPGATTTQSPRTARVPSGHAGPDVAPAPQPSGLPPVAAGTVAHLQRVQALAGNQAVLGLIGGGRPRPAGPVHTTGVGVHRRYPGHRAVQRQDARPAGQSDATAAPTGEGWTDTGTQVLVHQPDGAYIRDQPLPERDGSAVLAELPQNTRVLSLRHNPVTRWHAVRIVEGEHAGMTGYLADWLVRDDAPDTGAVIYDVQSGDHLGMLVQNHPQYAGYPIVTGDDARTLVMAVYTANPNSRGVRLVGDADSGLFDPALDALDDFREVTRRIYQTIELVAGEQIWLPGSAYVNALKASGTIPQRAGWKNAAIEAGKRIAGLNVGMVEGLVGSVVDLLVGMFDLAKGAIDVIVATITGEALAAIGELADYLDTLVEEGQILQFAKDVAAGLVHSVIEAGQEFLGKWNAPLVYDAWRFRGRVIGYVLAEVLMAFLSGGLSALKWLDKLGDVGKVARRVITRVEGAVDDLPVPGRRRGDGVPDGGRRFDGDDQLPPERLAVVLKARALAETHDAMDTPVNVAVAMLNTAFKPGNPWINEFYSEPKAEPGHYRIVMRTPIDDDYSNERRDVWDHEGNGGHAIDRHVGKDLNWLRRRLQQEPDIEAASTFTSVQLANRTQGTFVKQFRDEIAAWLKDNREGAPRRLTRTVEMPYIIGEVLERGANKTKKAVRATLVIVKDDTAHGWHFVTSFPVP